MDDKWTVYYIVDYLKLDAVNGQTLCVFPKV